MNEIDPMEFGELRADVKTLKDNLAKMVVKLDDLTALANKSRGAFWAGMTIASLVGGIASWILAHFYIKP
jgi:hypothetical protein